MAKVATTKLGCTECMVVEQLLVWTAARILPTEVSSSQLHHHSNADILTCLAGNKSNLVQARSCGPLAALLTQVRMQSEGKKAPGEPKKYANAFKAYGIIRR